MLDEKRYAEIAARAVGDAYRAAPCARAPGNKWYQSFVDCECSPGRTVPFRLAETQKFVKVIGSSIAGGPYDVLFFPIDSGHPWAKELRGFISWLFVHENDKTLLVVCNVEPLEQSVLGRDCVFSRAKTLEKVLLHECAHGVLHLSNLLEKMALLEKIAEETMEHPSLDVLHEQEAWFYVGVLLGVLSGEHSKWSRDEQGVDLGWQLA